MLDFCRKSENYCKSCRYFLKTSKNNANSVLNVWGFFILKNFQLVILFFYQTRLIKEKVFVASFIFRRLHFVCCHIEKLPLIILNVSASTSLVDKPNLSHFYSVIKFTRGSAANCRPPGCILDTHYKFSMQQFRIYEQINSERSLRLQNRFLKSTGLK